jgi:hypothetical protein
MIGWSDLVPVWPNVPRSDCCPFCSGRTRPGHHFPQSRSGSFRIVDNRREFTVVFCRKLMCTALRLVDAIFVSTRMARFAFYGLRLRWRFLLAPKSPSETGRGKKLQSSWAK